MADSYTEHAFTDEFDDHILETVPCAGNLPVSLDDPDSVWLIHRGSVNLFLVEYKDEVEQAAPQHLLSREIGAILPGVVPDVQDDDTTLNVIAKGSPGTVLKRVAASALFDVSPEQVAGQIDAWVIEITEKLSRYVSRHPRPTALAEAGRQRTYTPCVLSVRRNVVWMSQPPHGASLYMDMVDPTEFSSSRDSSDIAIPMTRSSWLSLMDEATLTEISSESLVQRKTLLPALASFHKIAFALERLNRQLAVVDDANLERARTTSRRMAEKAARRRLFNIYDQPIERHESVDDRVLADALEIIGHHTGIDFKIQTRSGIGDASVSLVEVLDASGVRARRVKLKNEDSWWRGDSNAMLAFRREDGQPVALLPGVFGRYREIDPITKQTVRINAERADTLANDAWLFYRPLPSENVQTKDLLSIAFHGSSADLFRLLIAGVAGGFIKLLPALALGFVATHAVNGGNIHALYVLATALAGFGLLGALLHMYQSTAMMRLEGRSASRLEAAFWDRLMRLPPSIVNRRPSGDLAMSGMTFQNLRDGVQGVVADSLLSIIFLLPVFGVIFLYDVTLGIISLVFSLAAVLITLVLGMNQIAPYGRMISAVRRVSGRLFQIVGGMSKLRVESAEGSAFDIWAQDYREQKRAELELGLFEGHSRAFGAALPFLAAGVILFVVVSQTNRDVPVSDFLVVYTVFITFQYAISRLSDSVGMIAATLPAFEQMRPLLGAIPESESVGDSVEYLGGDVLFDQISFRYDPDGPLILDDVTIHANPGEFIAIAGESGAGKSTLFRLALGLDRPMSGAVYYDGRDLRHLNLKQLRRKIGAVPQSVGLHPQDLWDNLVSHHQDPASDDVWRAVRVAEIEDEIKNMPMGMMTMVGTSGSVLSGGESQRVTIARSVMGSPKIMLFDEATNWLDNENQAEVMRNLTALTSTRIVIAHRLSTLEQADRIYVMQAGKVVQSGSFTELMEVEGVFKELVRRQIV